MMKRSLLAFLLLALCMCIGCQFPELLMPTAPAHEHLYDSGAVSEAPTHLENGLMTYTCVSCGDSFTDVIEKSGEHTWQFISVDGDKHSQGCE